MGHIATSRLTRNGGGEGGEGGSRRERERGRRARLGYLSRGPRVPSYATVATVDSCGVDVVVRVSTDDASRGSFCTLVCACVDCQVQTYNAAEAILVDLLTLDVMPLIQLFLFAQ